MAFTEKVNALQACRENDRKHNNGKPTIPTIAAQKAAEQAQAELAKAEGKTTSNNSAVNFYTKQVAAKEQAYKESVASDKKASKGMAGGNIPSDKVFQAKAELETAKQNLQKEIKTPLPNNK